MRFPLFNKPKQAEILRAEVNQVKQNQNLNQQELKEPLGSHLLFPSINYSNEHLSLD